MDKDEVIKKVLFRVKTFKTESELSKETIEAIKKARQRIKKGQFVSEDDARKRL